MALQARRFHGNPLLQPDYNFRDVPYASRDLSGSTLSVVTERQHLVDSIAELTLLCNEATRRGKKRPGLASPTAKKTTKPLSIEYIFDRIDTDDPLWGLMVRTDTPVSLKGRASNLKSSPHWKRGMLQGFITMTTFTNWQSSFRFDSLHEMAFGQDDDALEEQMKDGLRKYDEDGSLAEDLEACVKGGNPHVEGIVYPRIAEVALFGGLGCGRQLLRLLIEHLEHLKANASQNYDFIVLQATDNSIPFYESMGFTRVGCVQGKAPSANDYHSSPIFDYYTKKNGETPISIAKELGVDVWDIVFLNKTVHPGLVQKSWLKMGTRMFIPKVHAGSKEMATSAPVVASKWYISQENETPRSIAKKFQVNFSELLEANKKRHPDLTGHSKLLEGTRIQISRFDHDEGDTIAYSHWTFPDAVDQDDLPSYMMALKLNRKKGQEAKVKPVEDSFAVSLQPYSPQLSGAKDLMLQPKIPKAHVPLAPIFTKKSNPREPKKPKRPATSYTHFTADCRSNMAAELEGMSLAEINKLLSEKWKALSDEEKIPYQDRSESSRAVFRQAMKKYEADMELFQRESIISRDIPEATAVDSSLLEKVIKLKSNHGISGVSKFEYYYVLTFIPDLQWVHLIPMRKVGVFGPEHPDASGRPIWMIFGEDEGKEFDANAEGCQVVTAITMNNSPDADDEQWNIYDNGEIPPPPRPVPIFTPNVPDAPIRPKKPATSFAFFCRDAKTLMREQLENKPLSERTKVIAERWSVMSDVEKKQYKDQYLQAHEKYAKALKQYKEDLAKFQRENPGLVDTSSLSASSTKKAKSAKKHKSTAVSSLSTAGTGKTQEKSKDCSRNDISTKTPQSSKKLKSSAVSTPISADNGGSLKKRGRPMKHPPPEKPVVGKEVITPTPKRKRGRPRKNPLPDNVSSTKVTVKRVKNDPVLLEQLLGKLKGGDSPGAESNATPERSGDLKPTLAGDNDLVLSLLNDKYKNVMWSHFKKLGKAQKGGTGEGGVAKKILGSLKMGLGGRFLKKSVRSDELYEVSESVALQKITRDLRRRMESSRKWLEEDINDTSSSVEESPSLSPTRRARWGGAQHTSSAVADVQPKLSPSLHPQRKSIKSSEVKKHKLESPSKTYHFGEGDAHIPSKPAEGLPEGWVTRKIPRKNPRDSRVDTRWYSPELNLRFRSIHDAKTFAERVEASGKGEEAVVMQPMSPSKAASKSRKGPLAPIFLKDYGKKNKKQARSSEQPPDDEETKEVSSTSSRYPGRKRKPIIDCGHVVSDDASSDVIKPRKKRTRTE
eukprot:CAMPEP_0181140362 /NCGR_PEP_ID=MMETSP1071-20121207/35265_1 /TAXON_ID=35127 /ORGANISM="Thalassiosira sp., Strain NH16" /LENGTH=1283 /DNA_ID=CAMNT_0023227311 /DNA_START=344 /DNA_END=4195 /DNA_ORIENTATION=+